MIITKLQDIKNSDGDTIYVVPHVYSTKGHIETTKGLYCGWHIENAPADEYVEVDDGLTNAIPDELPDIIINDEPEDGES